MQNAGKAIEVEVDSHFAVTVRQHVHHVVGFFCKCWEGEEAEHHSSKNNVVECVTLLSSHFVLGRKNEKVDPIKKGLPSGVADLVDQCCSSSGLKHSD